MKKSDIKKKHDIVEEVEESKHIDFLYTGLIISIVLLCILELVLASKATIHIYNTTGSILEATSMFILGIMADLAIITLFLMAGGLSDLMNYTMYPLMVFLIIEVILVLLGLV